MAVVFRVDEQTPLVAEWTPEVGTGIVFASVSRETYKMLTEATKFALQISLKDRGTRVLMFPAARTKRRFDL